MTKSILEEDWGTGERKLPASAAPATPTMGAAVAQEPQGDLLTSDDWGLPDTEPVRREPEQRSMLEDDNWQLTEKIESHGFVGDITRAGGRGAARAVEMTGRGLEEIGIETVGGTLKEVGEKVGGAEFLAPDKEEIAGEDGFVKRSLVGATESIPVSMVPFMTAAAGGLVAGPAGAAVGGAAGLGVVIGGGTYSAEKERATKELRDLNPDWTPEQVDNEAHRFARNQALWETVTEGASDLVTFGVGKALATSVAKQGARSAATTLKFLLALGPKEFAKAVGKQYAAEGASEVVAYLGQAENERAFGLGEGPDLQGVLDTAAVSFWMTGVMGGGMVGFNQRYKNRVKNRLQSDNPVELKLGIKQMESGISDQFGADKAAEWRTEAESTIASGGKLDINAPIFQAAQEPVTGAEPEGALSKALSAAQPTGPGAQAAQVPVGIPGQIKQPEVITGAEEEFTKGQAAQEREEIKAEDSEITEKAVVAQTALRRAQALPEDLRTDDERIMIRDEERRGEAEQREVKKQIRREAEEVAGEHPAHTSMTEAIKQGGINIELAKKEGWDVDSLKDIRRPGLFSKDAGVGPDEMAQTLGYESEEAMKNEWVKAPTKKELVLSGITAAEDQQATISESADQLEKEGFDLGKEETIPAGNLSPGDEVVIIDERGIPDKLTHEGFNADGDAILKDGKTVYADQFDQIDIIAKKTGSRETGDKIQKLFSDLRENTNVDNVKSMLAEIPEAIDADTKLKPYSKLIKASLERRLAELGDKKSPSPPAPPTEKEPKAKKRDGVELPEPITEKEAPAPEATKPKVPLLSKRAVERALRKGESVSPEVMAKYPELAPAAPEQISGKKGVTKRLGSVVREEGTGTEGVRRSLGQYSAKRFHEERRHPENLSLLTADPEYKKNLPKSTERLINRAAKAKQRMNDAKASLAGNKEHLVKLFDRADVDSVVVEHNGKDYVLYKPERLTDVVMLTRAGADAHEELLKDYQESGKLRYLASQGVELAIQPNTPVVNSATPYAQKTLNKAASEHLQFLEELGKAAEKEAVVKAKFLEEIAPKLANSGRDHVFKNKAGDTALWIRRKRAVREWSTPEDREAFAAADAELKAVEGAVKSKPGELGSAGVSQGQARGFVGKGSMARREASAEKARAEIDDIMKSITGATLPKGQRADIMGELTKQLGRNVLAQQKRGVFEIVSPERAAQALGIVDGVKKSITAWHGTPFSFPAESRIKDKKGKTIARFVKGDKRPGETVVSKLRSGEYTLEVFSGGRFRSDKIKMNEGAYGWGHYLAEQKIEAKGYKREYTGALYKVKVDLDNDSSELLDWEGTIGEQPESVKKFITDIGFSIQNATDLAFDGSGLYSLLRKMSDIGIKNDADVSALLLKHGVKGVKFKSHMNPLKSNYVIFDEDALSIEAKYSKDGQRIEGLTFPDGRVWLVDGNIEKGNAAGVLAHELGVHAKKLGFKDEKSFQAILKRIESLSKTDKNVKAARERVPDDTPNENVNEETLAYLVSDAPQHGLAKRLISGLKKFLAERGWFRQSIDKLAPADLQAMAQSAIRQIDAGLAGRAAEGVNKFTQSVKKSTSEAVAAIKGMANFKAWVGNAEFVEDFEDLDYGDVETGKPVVIQAYHGTGEVFTEFDPSKLGVASEDVGGVSPSALIGFYFSGPNVAKWFAEHEVGAGGTRSGEVMPVYLKLESPKVLEGDEFIEMVFGFEARQEYFEGIVDEIENMTDSDLYVEIDEDFSTLYFEGEEGAESDTQAKLDELSRELSSSNTELGIGWTSEDWSSYTEELKNDGHDGIYVEPAEDSRIQNEELEEPNIIVFNPAQIKSIHNTGEWSATDPDIMKSITAWHGTPHEVVKFRTSSIGTGQSQQAAGYGLYFTDKKEIAEHYRNILSEEGKGNIYKVSLAPEESDFLRWDLSVPEQGKDVVLMLKKSKSKAITDYFEYLERVKDFEPDLNGAGQVYRELSVELGSEEKASSHLLDLGIKGVKYKESLKGLHGFNYVVFDDSDIFIKDKHSIKNQRIKGPGDPDITKSVSAGEIEKPGPKPKVAAKKKAVEKGIDKIWNKYGSSSPLAADLKTWLIDRHASIKKVTDRLGSLPESQDYLLTKRLAGNEEATEKRTFYENKAKPLLKTAIDLRIDHEVLADIAWAKRNPLQGKDILDKWKANRRWEKISKAADDLRDISTEADEMLRGVKADVPNISQPRTYSEVIDKYYSAISTRRKNEADKVLKEMVKNNPSDLWEIESTAEAPKNPKPNTQIKINVDGEDFVITVPADSHTMTNFVKAVNHTPAPTGPVLRASRRVNRVLAALNTSFNPEFPITNFLRDIQTAGIHLESEEATKNMQKAVFKNIKGAIKTINAIEGGKEAKGELAESWKTLKKIGGKMEFADTYRDMEELDKVIKNDIDWMKGDKPKALKKLKKAKDVIERLNTSVENGVRLSTFNELLKTGISPRRAVRITNNLTVDFTRYGTAGPAINSLWMFANAGIQGNVRMITAIRSNPKVRKIAGGIIALGFAQNIMNAMLGGDDDDGESYYDKLIRSNPSLAERNMIFMIPGSKGKYIRIPMPYGYSMLHLSGNEIGSAVRGPQGYSSIEGMGRIMAGALNTLNPVGAATALQTISPTVIDPIVQSYENKTWYGGDLMPGTFGMEKPDAMRYWRDVNPAAKSAARMMNSLTGGSSIRSGLLDISPETIENVIGNLTGGAGALAVDVLTLPLKPFKDDGMAVRDIPFMRKLSGGMDMRRVDNSIFRSNLKAVDLHRREVKAGDVERDPKTSSLFASAKQAARFSKKLRKQIQAAEDSGNSERKRMLQWKLSDYQVRFNTLYSTR